MHGAARLVIEPSEAVVRSRAMFGNVIKGPADRRLPLAVQCGDELICMFALGNSKGIQMNLTTCTLLLIAVTAQVGERLDHRVAFDSLYASRIKAARQTVNRSDDVALAQELLAAAEMLKGQVSMLVLVCDAAYDLAAVDSSGYGIAVAAMHLVIEHAPDSKARAIERVIAVRDRQFGTARGDDRIHLGAAILQDLISLAEINSASRKHGVSGALLRKAMVIAKQIKSEREPEIKLMLDEVNERQKAQLRIDQLQAALDTKPNLASAREIIRLHVSEMDDPLSAGESVLLLGQDPLANRVMLATRPLRDLNETDALDLGVWYYKLADQTVGTFAKRKMLTRASMYLRRFLTLYENSDKMKEEAQLTLALTNAALGRQGGPLKTSLLMSKSTSSIVDSPADRAGPGTINFTKSKPAAYLSVDEAAGLDLVDLPDSRFVLNKAANPGFILMKSKHLRLKLDDKIAHDLPSDANERWFLRLTTAKRPSSTYVAASEFLYVTYDGHDGTFVPRPRQLPISSAQFDTYLVELGHPRLANLKSEGDIELGFGYGDTNVSIHRVELHRVMLSPKAGRVVYPGEGVESLRIMDPVLDRLEGSWQLGRVLSNDSNYGNISVPLRLSGSYDLDITFLIKEGTPELRFILPFGKSCALMIFDSKLDQGGFSGVEVQDSQIAKRIDFDKSAVRGQLITVGKEHRARLRVRATPTLVSVDAELDGRPVGHWQGPESTLRPGGSWSQDQGRPGFWISKGRMEIRSALFRVVDGEAMLLTPTKDQIGVDGK